MNALELGNDRRYVDEHWDGFFLASLEFVRMMEDMPIKANLLVNESRSYSFDLNASTCFRLDVLDETTRRPNDLSANIEVAD